MPSHAIGTVTACTLQVLIWPVSPLSLSATITLAARPRTNDSRPASSRAFVRLGRRAVWSVASASPIGPDISLGNISVPAATPSGVTRPPCQAYARNAIS